MNFSSHLYRQIMKKMTSQTTTVTDRKEEDETTPSLRLKQAKIPVEIMAEKGISATSMEGEDEGRTVLVSGVPTDFRLEAIQSYFENKKISSGGPFKGIPERIQDSGEVIITFESEKDAENVVKKKVHNVSKHELQVDWYKNLVWQEDAMIVSNGHKDMSEKMLTDFLEENRKLEIVHVFLEEILELFLCIAKMKLVSFFKFDLF
ncbi:protein mono-ADP-ribosyltransferase PARP14-like [Octopus vulgaris]|uniref:Protein mono-ADP-ribosyltransferase PARP14-like n=1 Tax=Octopus vulgaris TaxID=6645 RepID=A0AA36EVQ8_OCTVU|nr:protein mono-ADP-ribosyltransferase PARP14-like [Octopus vulgaris]